MAQPTPHRLSAARSREEVEAALASLSPAVEHKLLAQARLHTFGIARGGFLPIELVREALTRALSGTRQWPRDVSLQAFMKGCIRSIADEWTEKHAHEAVPYSQLAREQAQAYLNVPDPAPHADPTQVVTTSWLDEVYAAVAESLRQSNEPLAVGILRGWREGQSNAEIQQALGIDEKVYKVKAQLTRRRMVKHAGGSARG